jgi:hypothetical protein
MSRGCRTRPWRGRGSSRHARGPRASVGSRWRESQPHCARRRARHLGAQPRSCAVEDAVARRGPGTLQARGRQRCSPAGGRPARDDHPIALAHAAAVHDVVEVEEGLLEPELEGLVGDDEQVLVVGPRLGPRVAGAPAPVPALGGLDLGPRRPLGARAPLRHVLGDPLRREDRLDVDVIAVEEPLPVEATALGVVVGRVGGEAGVQAHGITARRCRPDPSRARRSRG